MTVQDISAARGELQLAFPEGSAGDMTPLDMAPNGGELAAKLQAYGLELAALKASPYFGTFRREMADLQASLRVLADLVDCLQQV